MTEIKADIISNEVSADDRPDLEKKIISLRSKSGTTFTGVVVGVNRAVGITIINQKNKDHFLVCMPGPIMPQFKDVSHEYDNDNWDAVYDVVVSGIEAGVLFFEDIRAEFHAIGYGMCDGSNCAYRQ